VFSCPIIGLLPGVGPGPKPGSGHAPKVARPTMEAPAIQRANFRPVKEPCDPNSHCAEIIRASNAAIISVTLECRVQSWNPGAEALFGHSAAETLGHDLMMIVPEDRLAEAVANHARVIAGKTFKWETVLRHKSGRLVAVVMYLAPTRDPDGRIVGACAVSHKLAKRALLKSGTDRKPENRQRLERAHHEGAVHERKRIAQELHDHLCQHLVGAAFAAKALSISLPPSSEATAEADEVARLVNSAVQQVRNIARGLNSMAVDSSKRHGAVAGNGSNGNG
jgi:PAS domain S-box-containing protein